MIHKGCGGNIAIDVSELYTLQSPAFTISVKGIIPGMMELSSKDSSGRLRLFCQKCGDHFSDKKDYEDELQDTCSVCGELYSPSEIKVTEPISKICNNCLEGKSSGNGTQKRILSLYGGAIRTADSPTLLTVMMKKM